MKEKEILFTEDLQICLICSVRYAIGRHTYMPSLVQQTIIPLLPYFSDNNLRVLFNDLNSDPYFFGNGTEDLGDADWSRFKGRVREELLKRGKIDT